ncbi:hypothetical protein K431DRAFT_32021 [Polychaeton citri CBS 116435]|uniref:Uncharacterized protein n=1 Tax=Polychaeton citri CBS 116435 TaxID=1314669 RepID=A0A9P4USH7_9PEZI|nr:hypothetical protein K431DRAFT_32021 [Polychaeton citri CBS 116435]
MLEARVDTDQPVTISSFSTLLGSNMPALEYQGLTFAGSETGEPARRPVIDYQWAGEEFITANSPSALEIPSKSSDRPLVVSHRFKFRSKEYKETRDGIPWLYNEALKSIGQTAGFEVGRRYETGLGTAMSCVRWWEQGGKDRVFATNPQRSRTPRLSKPSIRMILISSASFTVVE